jgi:outer membrane lipoprotein-sorting protein
MVQKAIFQSISLIFQQNKLREMRLIDKLGQQTVVNFSQVELNPYLASQTFHFIIPTNKNIELVKG